MIHIGSFRGILRLALLALPLSVLPGCGFVEDPLINTVKTNNIVFIGDSITWLWGQQAEFQSHTNWINKGISGQSSELIAGRFLTDVIALSPKTVNIIAGTNDVYPGWQPCAPLTAFPQGATFEAPTDT